MIRLPFKQTFAALGACLALALPVSATTMVSSVDNGIFLRASSSIGMSSGTNVTHDASNQSRSIGQALNIGGITSNSAGYFIFDLSGFTGTATSASFSLDLANVDFVLSPALNMNFNVVTTPAAAFDLDYNESSNGFRQSFGADPLGPGNAIVSDLLSGPLAGSISVTGDGATSFSFTADGLASLNAAVGGKFVLGFDLLTVGGATLNSEVLTIEGLSPAPIPLPLPAAMLLGGLALLPVLRRKA